MSAGSSPPRTGFRAKHGEEGRHLGVAGRLGEQRVQVGLGALALESAGAEPEHVQELLGGLRPLPRRAVDDVRLLVRVEVLRIDGEDAPQVLQRLVVQPVLHVDVRLREQLLDLLPAERHGCGATGAGGAAGAQRPAPRRWPATPRCAPAGRGRSGPPGGRRGALARLPGHEVRVRRVEPLDPSPRPRGPRRAGCARRRACQLLVDAQRLAGVVERGECLRQEVQVGMSRGSALKQSCSLASARLWSPRAR
jgi:hypothetical protein